MSTINAKAGEKIAVLGYVNPQNVQNSEKYTDVIDMANVEQAIGFALLGDMASENIAFTAYHCLSNGAVATVIKACANLAASAGANDNKILAISVRREELNANSAQYVKFGLVTGSNTGGNAAVLALGVDATFQPASVLNLANVAEVKL